jgi:hypothetical protein
MQVDGELPCNVRERIRMVLVYRGTSKRGKRNG